MTKHALITGGGTGIGRGIALALARRGYALSVAGRRAELLEQTARLCAALDVPTACIPADLAQPNAASTVVDNARANLGPIDLLVCNAAVMAGGALDRMDAGEIERAVAVNISSPMLLVQAALPDLAERGGAVVLVCSMAALAPLPYASVYSGTKAGLRAFGEALRYELEPRGVRVLIANPGATDTAMNEGAAEAAGVPAQFVALAPPETVGEQIVSALEANRREITAGGAERLLALGTRFAPPLAHAALRLIRERLRRMMERA